jgi:hypothetical protein
MRTLLAIVVTCTVVMVGSVVPRAEKPTPEFQKAMKELEATTELMIHQLRLIERYGTCCYEPVEKTGGIIREAFGVALKYWQARKAELTTKVEQAGDDKEQLERALRRVDNAMRMAQFAYDDAGRLVAGAAERHFDRVDAAQGAVLQSCEPCHNVTREQMPDGTFEIR